MFLMAVIDGPAVSILSSLKFLRHQDFSISAWSQSKSQHLIGHYKQTSAAESLQIHEWAPNHYRNTCKAQED